MAQTQISIDKQALSIEAATLKLKAELDSNYQKQIHILKKEKECEILDIKEAWRNDKLKWSRIMDEENDKQRDLEKELELLRKQAPVLPAFFSPSNNINSVNPAKWECYPFDSLVLNKEPIVKKSKPIINNWVPQPASIFVDTKPILENNTLSNSFEHDYNQSVDRMDAVSKELDFLRKNIELKEHMNIINQSLPISIQTNSNFEIEGPTLEKSSSLNKAPIFTDELDSEPIIVSTNYLQVLNFKYLNLFIYRN